MMSSPPRRPQHRWKTRLRLLGLPAPGRGRDLREASHAPPPSERTSVGRAAGAWLAPPDTTSGFLELVSGKNALGARLRLIERAERTVDLQYFLVKPDLAGVLIAERLLAAAERGVRVRVLLDDVFTTARDDQLAILDNHPRIEVRIFNPLSRLAPTWLAFLWDFPRANRRMHNKSFTVDNAITIVGGRNIADEYFEIEQGIEFVDFDVAGIGPVAVEVSKVFDLFWNSALSVPLSALAPRGGPRHGPRVERIDQLLRDVGARGREVYADAVQSSFFDDLMRGAIEPSPGSAVVVSDPPEKLLGQTDIDSLRLLRALQEAVDRAEREVLIVSPYFVPGAAGTAYLKALRARGVRVTVVTNSLASTNHPYVHGGYAGWRRPLLECGVRLFEAKADAPVPRVTGENRRLTLHTKAVVIDETLAFIGSFNMDPRSVVLNTEIGIFIRSPPLASRLSRTMMAELARYAYALELDPRGRILWRHDGVAGAIVHHREPDASAWRRALAFVVAFLPIKGQL